MNITYRIYDKIPAFAMDIRTTVFVEEQGFIDDVDEVDAVASHIVAFDGEMPIATCRVFLLEAPDVYMMGRLAVLKEYRGQGIGSQVLTRAEQRAASLGGSVLCLHAQYHAVGFYQSLGYSTYGELEYEQDAPHIWMKKALY